MKKMYYSHKFAVLSISLLLIISSGEIIYERYYSAASIIFLLIVLSITIIEKKYKHITIVPTIYLFYLLIVLIINIIINNEVYINNYIGVFIKLLTVYLFCIIVKFNEFKESYTKIIYILCIISLIFYFVGIFYSSFVYLLPEIKYGSIDQYYKYAIIHSFRCEHIFLMYDDFSKNSSIFWEPGAYQFFLNLALYFEINKNKKSMIRILVYIAGIISTFSTTGLFTLFIILLFNIRIGKKIQMKKVFVMFLILILINTCVYKNMDDYFNKFKQGNNSYISYESRLTNTKEDLDILLKYPLGVGYTNYFKYNIGGSENSVTSLSSMYGLLYAFPMFFGIFLLAFRMKFSYTQFIVFPLLIFLSCLSEKFFFTPIIMYLSILPFFRNNFIDEGQVDKNKLTDKYNYKVNNYD
ncbi:hypothetical protein LGK97_09440 [Clostridium sp. CS001]|uniref:hypothetical protein n=1 Tax=Clostridium sp. CS001 TaxID=2880648 RepID=UPI001CF418E2|nr:hypothetical protein [Clostridium sp. CS001]MCB2289989.1 hypothetical protein [Clostridium sp. CS001]